LDIGRPDGWETPEPKKQSNRMELDLGQSDLNATSKSVNGATARTLTRLVGYGGTPPATLSMHFARTRLKRVNRVHQSWVTSIQLEKYAWVSRFIMRFPLLRHRSMRMHRQIGKACI
jgi:hypothetical protein